MSKTLDMPESTRSRRFAVRGLVLCWVFLMAELAIFACLLLHAQQERYEQMQHVNETPAARCDVPIMSYPQYLEMMKGGKALITQDGEPLLVEKSDFSSSDLRVLGLMLRAE